MEFHILGPLEVVEGGGPIELGRPKQRAVLALLLTSANRVLSLDRIVELLWDGEAPARATGALQAYVSNLRRVLEPGRSPRAAAQVLVTQAPGYVLRVPPDDLDAARFECLAGRGHQLLSAGRPVAARAALEEALSLWRGPALAEFAAERFARAEAARLEARRTVALEDRLEADLALGRHGPAVPELEAVVRDDPLRERAWALLMLALYRSGRQAEALRAYARARRTLAEELGVEPSPALRQLEGDVLAQSPTLEWHAPAAEPDELPAPVPPAPTVESPPAGDRLVGRDAQVRMLSAALADAEAGRGRLVLVSGEAGIGKTRLAEELAAVAEERGAVVVWGRAYEADGAPPFWPWTQVVRGLLPAADDPELDTALAGGHELAQLVPDLAERLGQAKPGERASDAEAGPGPARFRLYEAVTALLAMVARDRPVAVFLDDLHWADSLSVRLLVHLGLRLAGERVLVVATYRRPEGEEGGALADVLGELARVPTVRRLGVPGLSVAEVGRFMAQAGGLDPTPEQAAAVHARTEGNPFFVAELSRLVASEGLTSIDAVPAGVRDVVRRRLARLPDPTRALLVVAAVAGREFDLAVAAAAAQVELDDAVALVEAAVATGIVAEDGARPGHYRFSHALVRDTVYAGVSGLRRARLHARVGAALEGLPDAATRTSELASHFLHAAVVEGPQKALAYALAGADQALAGLGYEQAGHHLETAQELVASLPPGAERARWDLRIQNRSAVLLTVADGFTAPSATSGWDRAGRLRDAVDDLDQQLASDWGLLSLSCMRADVASTGRLGRALLQRGTAGDKLGSSMAGHFGLGRAALFCGDLVEALARFQEARRLGDTLEPEARLEVFGWLDPAVLCRVNAGLVLALLGDPDRAEEAVEDGIDVARRAGHPVSCGAALMFHTGVAVLGDRPADATERARALHDLATRHGLPDFVAQATVFGGWAAGEPHEVERGVAAKRASGFQMWQTWDLGLLADARRRTGDVDGARRALDDAFATMDATDERFYEAELLRLRGESLPDPAEAERGLRHAVAMATTQGARLFRLRAERGLERVPAPAGRSHHRRPSDT